MHVCVQREQRKKANKEDKTIVMHNLQHRIFITEINIVCNWPILRSFNGYQSDNTLLLLYLQELEDLTSMFFSKMIHVLPKQHNHDEVCGIENQILMNS